MNSSDTVDLSTYRRHLARARNGGNWFVFFRGYTKFLKKAPALFLQDVMNLADLPGVISEDIDGEPYFLCTEEFLVNSPIGWSSNEQKRHIATLQKKGLVKVKRRGIPGRRWLCVCYEQIETALDEAESGRGKQKTTNKSGYFHTNKRGGKQPGNNTTMGTKDGGATRPAPSKPRLADSPNGRAPSPQDCAAAAQLEKALRANLRPVDKKKCPPKYWPEHFRRLREEDRQDYQPALDWYCAHCSAADEDRYRLPYITNAANFRDFFPKISQVYRRATGAGRRSVIDHAQEELPQEERW